MDREKTTKDVAEEPSIFLSRLQLKNFRCFRSFTIELEKSMILFEGENGAGKTSLLEALYYTGYLRSFRTHRSHELIRFGQDNFFVHAQVTNNLSTHEFTHDIHIGFCRNRKLVKVDQKPIISYKELMHTYRVVSLTEDDLALVNGSPQVRRTFIDHVLLLSEPDYAMIIKLYRQTLEQRNALLQQRSFNRDTYEILTQQIWEHSRMITELRIKSLAQLNEIMNELVRIYFDQSFSTNFSYHPKYLLCDSLQEFTDKHPLLYDHELRYGRTLFGVHLDDILIQFQHLQARHFASRGQQKLLVLLIKIAQVKQLANTGLGAVMLLDDFMTDFDPKRGGLLLDTLLGLNIQLIFTSPIEGSLLGQHLTQQGAQVIKLTN